MNENNPEQKTLFSIGELSLVWKKKKEETPLTQTEFRKKITEGEYVIDPHTGFYTKSENVPKKKRGITNERQSILAEILEEINKERAMEYLQEMKDDARNKRTPRSKPTYPELKGRALAMKLSHIPTKDLYFLLSQGKDYKRRVKGGSIGKYVFGAIKTKK